MRFCDLASELDDLVFGDLGDPATLNGRPVSGMLEHDAQEQQRFGTLRAGLFEPRFVIRSSDALDTDRGAVLVVDLPVPEGGSYDVVDTEPHSPGLTALILRPHA